MVEVEQLHIFFFPMLAQGHMLPILDMANLFSSRGVKSTLITTNYHVAAFEQAIQRSRDSGFDISVREIEFPALENGLPEGTESVELVKSQELMPNFTKAIFMLQDQLESLLQECRPHCLVADSFFPWTTDLAAKFGIPRLVFDGVGYFPTVVREVLRLHRPFSHVSSDSEAFLVPDIPHQIKLTLGQVPLYDRQKEEAEAVTGVLNFFQQVRESNSKSFGTIVNSFYELEADYADYHTEKMGRKSWHVGPLFLCKNVEDKKSDIEEWLDLKSPNSVVYICFGSRANFKADQLHEIAKGLEITGRSFIWVVRDCADEEDQEKWLPAGFSERSKDKGLVVMKEWAPQTLILQHESVGAFVTHCGWNSTLEGVGCGVPVVTWPLFAEQFLNEKLLVDVLRVGVGIGIGSRQWSWVTEGGVRGEALATAVERVMGGGEEVEIRRRCEAMKEMAGKSVEEGGSSYNCLNHLVEELKAFHSKT